EVEVLPVDEAKSRQLERENLGYRLVEKDVRPKPLPEQPNPRDHPDVQMGETMIDIAHAAYFAGDTIDAACLAVSVDESQTNRLLEKPLGPLLCIEHISERHPDVEAEELIEPLGPRQLADVHLHALQRRSLEHNPPLSHGSLPST